MVILMIVVVVVIAAAAHLQRHIDIGRSRVKFGMMRPNFGITYQTTRRRILMMIMKVRKVRLTKGRLVHVQVLSLSRSRSNSTQLQLQLQPAQQ